MTKSSAVIVPCVNICNAAPVIPTCPSAETPTHYIVYGMDPDLDLAMKNAMLGTLDFFKEKLGYNPMQAYTLASAAVDYRVTQVVDRTLGVHAMIAKKLFINDADNYWYRTPRF